MTFELETLTTNVARAIILDLADVAKGYNKEWSWWAYDALKDHPYKMGTLNVTLIKSETVGDDYDSYGENEELLLVWQIEGEWSTTRFYTMTGRSQSYGGNEWDGNFREAKAKTKTVIVYE